MTDGSVIIDAGLNTEGLKDDIAGLKHEIKKEFQKQQVGKDLTFSTNVEDVEKNLRHAMDRLEEARKQVGELQAQVNRYSGDKNSGEFKTLLALLDQKTEEAKAAEKAYHDAFDQVEHRGRYAGSGGDWFADSNVQKEIEKISEASEKLNEMRARLETADKALEALEGKGLWFGDKEFDDAYKKLEGIKYEIKSYKAELTNPASPQNPFGMDTLAGKIREAEIALKQLAEQGKGLGSAEYNAAYRNLALLKAEAKELQKQLARTPEQEQAILQLQRQIANAEQSQADIRNNAAVADQRMVDLNRELLQLKERQKELSKAGVGFGFQEYDQNAARIKEITQLIKEYQNNLTGNGSPETSLYLQKLSDDALQAKQRLIDLNAKYDELFAKQSEGTGGDLSAQLKDTEGQIIEQIKYINGLAQNDVLGKLTSGAEVAAYRIENIKQKLAELNEQRRNARSLSESETASLDKSISAYQHMLEVYQRNLDAANSGAGMQDVAEGAEIANQHIVDLNRELQELQARQKDLQQSGIGLGYKEYDEVTAKITEVTRQLKEYQKSLSGSGKGPEEQVSRTAQAMEKLSSILGKLSPSFGEKTSEIAGKVLPALETIAPKLSGQIAPAIEAVGTAIGGIAAKLAPVLVILKLIYDAAKKVLKAAAEEVGKFLNAVQTGAAALWKAGGTLAGWLAKGVESAGKFGSTAAKAFAAAAESLTELMKKLNVFTKLSDIVGAKLKRLGQMIRRVFVFSVITKGLREMRSQISAYLSLNEQFSIALRRLQGVLLTAFQPIYEVIVPALTTLIQVLSQAIAVVSQFFASLFGTTAKKAQANAKALYGQAKALEETGKAADEAAGSLAGFDEINTIQTENDSGSGGGGGGADTGPLFDWDYDEETFGSWGEAFSAFLDKLLAGLPKLEEAFKKFADWLNGLAKKLYDMFTFPGVLDKVKALGKGLAEALNKLVNWIDWELLGRALGAGLNLALNFLTSFLYAFDWMNLGRKLAEFVNGLVDEIDWYEFGRLLWAGFKIALETLAGFILGLDMPLMARAASETVKGFFDEMYNTIARINWREIGRQIARFLNNIDWYGCITSALTAIQAAIVALAAMVMGFVDELNWSSIAQKIYRAINDSLGQIDWRSIGVVIGDAFKAIFDFVREVVAGINWHQIGENIADFILGFDFAGALSGLAMLIAEAINAAVQLVCGFLDRMVPELRGIAERIVTGLKEAVETVDWAKLGEVIGRGIKGALTFVSGLLDPDLFYAIGKAIGDFLVNLDWVGIVGGLTDVLARAIGAAVAAVTGFLDSVQPNLKAIADGIARKINEFVQNVDWAELGQTISRGIEAALDFLIELMDQIDWDAVGQAIADFLTNIDWSTLLEKWGRLLGEVINAKMRSLDISAVHDVGRNIIAGLWNGMWEKFNASGGVLGMIRRYIVDDMIQKIMGWLGIHSPSTVFAEIGRNIIAGLLQGITETWNSIVEFFSGKIEALKQTISDAWENIKTATSEKWEGIKSALGTAWDSIKEKAGTAFDAVKEKISAAWESTKEKTSTIWDSIKTTLSTTWDNIKTTAKTAFDNIKTAISTAWENTKTATTNAWNNIKTALTNAWNNLKTAAKTAFDNIKTTISQAWESIKSAASAAWNSIKSTLSGIWDNLKSDASSKFEGIKSTISQAWENVKSSTSSAWSSIKSTVSGVLSEISSSVSSTFSNIVSSAKSWGQDIGNNISSGMQKAGSTVKNAVTSVADRIRSNLHFSEPDEGPLSDFHTYMPDMLELMAKGIRDNTHLAVSAASDLADSIANTVSGKNIGVNMNMPDITKFSVPLIAQGAAIPANREFSMVVQGEDGGGDSLARLEKLLGNLTERMNSMEIVVHNETTLDGKVIARNTVRHVNDMTRSAGKPVLLF